MAKFAIIQKRFYYEGTFNVERGWTLYSGGMFEDYPEFESRAAAKKDIERAIARVYYLAHGEYSSPDYRIVEVGGRLYKASERRTFGEYARK